MRENHAWGRGVTFGFLLGLAAGAVLGLLYAPAKGRKTRREIVRRAERFGEKTADVLESAEDLLETGRRKLAV